MTSVHASSCRMPEALPLGPQGLPEERRSREIAPGVVEHDIRRGFRSPEDHYALEVAGPLPEAEARKFAASLRVPAELVRSSTPADDRPGPEVPLFSVRTGSFATDAEARQARGSSGAAVVYTGEDGLPTSGPWSIHILDVDLAAFPGRVAPGLTQGLVLERGTVQSAAREQGALAGINGGYFVELPDQGAVGEPAGISVVDGRLLSEALDGRAALILQDGGARVARVSSHAEVYSGDGAGREVDGVNRPPGVVRSGASGAPGVAHDATLLLADDLVLFTPEFGGPTPAGLGAEAVLDGSGRVVAVHGRRGHEVPSGGTLLSGVGDGAGWLLSHAVPGQTLQVESEVLADGARLPLDGDTGVVNGGPTLLRGGKISVDAWREGFDRADDPTFHHRFGERRNGRTMAGTTPDGHLLLVTVDGHQPNSSIGLNFHEEARLMQALGATEAVNLDGGGSTTMLVGDQVVNVPSDPGGQRAIGDAVLLLPG